MRTTQDPTKPTMMFCFDLPDGGCVMQTPNGEEVLSSEVGDGETPYICAAGYEIFYPGWCEW